MKPGKIGQVFWKGKCFPVDSGIISEKILTVLSENNGKVKTQLKTLFEIVLSFSLSLIYINVTEGYILEDNLNVEEINRSKPYKHIYGAW